MKQVKIAKHIMIVILILSVAPLIVMGIYARPLWDDFSSTALLHQYLSEGRYISAIFSPIEYAIHMYRTWQGTYTAEIIFALQPGAWPIPVYGLTTIILIGSICMSYLYLGQSIVTVIFHSKKEYGILLVLPLLILQFQYVPFLHQAFYWFNGAMYYSFFMALLLFEIGLILNKIYQKEKNTWKSTVGIVVLATFISGGNYSTALINCMILVMLSCHSLYTKKLSRVKKLVTVTAFAILGLILSGAAPGNSVRASISVSMSPLKAIIRSILYAGHAFVSWTGIAQIGMLFLLIPIIYVIVKDSHVQFKYPVIACVIMFGIFAAQATPTYYAMSYAGAFRQVNMYYYTYYLLITACLIYVEGFAISKLKNKAFSKIAEKRIFGAGVLTIVIGVFIGGVHNLNFLKVSTDILSGDARQYAIEYANVINEIQSQDAICYIEDIHQETNSLAHFDIQTGPDFWINKSLANYFGKEKIILIENK